MPGTGFYGGDVDDEPLVECVGCGMEMDNLDVAGHNEEGMWCYDCAWADDEELQRANDHFWDD